MNDQTRFISWSCRTAFCCFQLLVLPVNQIHADHPLPPQTASPQVDSDSGICDRFTHCRNERMKLVQRAQFWFKHILRVPRPPAPPPPRCRQSGVWAGVCSGEFFGCSSWCRRCRRRDGCCCGTTCVSSGQTSSVNISRTPDTRTASLLENRPRGARVQNRYKSIWSYDSISLCTVIMWPASCLTCVYPPVFSQVTGNGEGLPTVLADIGPLARVRPHVFLQVTTGRPAFTAHRAHVRPLPGVPPHVHVEASECGEVFGAVGAAVGPLTSVCPQVALQTIAGLEALAALRAQEAALSGVGRPVGLQAGERAVRLAAQVALVRAEGVCALVDTKLGHPWRHKHLNTCLTSSGKRRLTSWMWVSMDQDLQGMFSSPLFNLRNTEIRNKDWTQDW